MKSKFSGVILPLPGRVISQNRLSDWSKSVKEKLANSIIEIEDIKENYVVCFKTKVNRIDEIKTEIESILNENVIIVFSRDQAWVQGTSEGKAQEI